MSQDITGYYAFGAGALDGEALENALGTEPTVPIANVPYASSGGGSYTIQDNGLVYGSEMHIIVDQNAGDMYETALGVGYGLANVGYCFKIGRLRIYPLFGIGGGGIGLDVTPRPGMNTSTILTALRMSRTNALVHIGIGFDFRVGKRIGLTFGARLGYIFAPFSGHEGISGPYFRVLFGGGIRG